MFDNVNANAAAGHGDDWGMIPNPIHEDDHDERLAIWENEGGFVRD